ncbi:MAG TPA: hypothetical protein VFO10_11255 [Oligoflexus sp.]|uniref:hypothetical protein n=1 Tax=Oligoflexus sp. TaxID=1971216 RepID=UPI002D80550B|nr:hypothetical protein [Oligoflexus sp.]HET9237822.1 hypothetical protein [Oligoflexus sp.]
MRPMFHKLSALLGVPLLELMVGCGVDPEALKNMDKEEGDKDEQETDTRLAPEHTVKAFLKLEDGLSAASGKFALVNCTGQIEQTFQDNRITLSDEAIGCRVAIQELQIGDRVFHSASAQSDWKTGDTLRFKAVDGSLESLDVHVDHQLSSTPSLAENVYFTVSRSDAAPSEGSKTLLAAGMEGQEAPGFRIRKTEFVGLTAMGAGQFVFHLDCLKTIKIGDDGSPTCNGIALGSIQYMLVKDAYNSSLTFDEAEALFQLRPSQTVDEKSDFEPFRAERKQYGGFATRSGDEVLEGPDQMHDNPNMLLLLQGPGPSYQYFNVDVVFTSH